MVDNPFSCESCENDAAFWVYERYGAGDGATAVESEVALCRECTEGVEPTHLDKADADYEFKVSPVAEAFGMVRL
jgi:hypothetical protein